MLTVTERRSLAEQVEVIEAQIVLLGNSHVGCDELRLLCTDEFAESTQWESVAKIAIQKRWTFTFCPDGSVVFAAFPPLLDASTERPTP